MCYITDGAIDHINNLEKRESQEMVKCLLCEDHTHESLCINHPMTNEPVCKWCIEDHSLSKDIITNSEAENLDDYLDSMVARYQQKFKTPKNK